MRISSSSSSIVFLMIATTIMLSSLIKNSNSFTVVQQHRQNAQLSSFSRPISSSSTSSTTTTSMHAVMPSSSLSSVSDLILTHASTSSTLMLAETEAWVQPTITILGPILGLLSFAMLCRVVISWYPSTNLNEFPWNVVAWPTEPFLKTTRNVVPPAFGVDITPFVWLGIFTFLNEIFLGQQGLLVLKIKYGI